MATTPEEFAAQMQEIMDTMGVDEHMAHEDMDALMKKVLVELGYSDGVDIFDKQDKYYS